LVPMAFFALIALVALVLVRRRWQRPQLEEGQHAGLDGASDMAPTGGALMGTHNERRAPLRWRRARMRYHRHAHCHAGGPAAWRCRVGPRATTLRCVRRQIGECAESRSARTANATGATAGGRGSYAASPLSLGRTWLAWPRSPCPSAQGGARVRTRRGAGSLERYRAPSVLARCSGTLASSASRVASAPSARRKRAIAIASAGRQAGRATEPAASSRGTCAVERPPRAQCAHCERKAGAIFGERALVGCGHVAWRAR
jgi:hypothetical protein